MITKFYPFPLSYDRSYMVISGVIFGIVAIIHLLRVINGWALVLGQYSVPMWVSWLGAVVPALLCIWAFRLAMLDR
jgi:hypothetical protein